MPTEIHTADSGPIRCSITEIINVPAEYEGQPLIVQLYREDIPASQHYDGANSSETQSGIVEGGKYYYNKVVTIPVIDNHDYKLHAAIFNQAEPTTSTSVPIDSAVIVMDPPATEAQPLEIYFAKMPGAVLRMNVSTIEKPLEFKELLEIDLRYIDGIPEGAEISIVGVLQLEDGATEREICSFGPVTKPRNGITATINQTEVVPYHGEQYLVLYVNGYPGGLQPEVCLDPWEWSRSNRFPSGSLRVEGTPLIIHASFKMYNEDEIPEQRESEESRSLPPPVQAEDPSSSGRHQDSPREQASSSSSSSQAPLPPAQRMGQPMAMLSASDIDDALEAAKNAAAEASSHARRAAEAADLAADTAAARGGGSASTRALDGNRAQEASDAASAAARRAAQLCDEVEQMLAMPVPDIDSAEEKVARAEESARLAREAADLAVAAATEGARRGLEEAAQRAREAAAAAHKAASETQGLAEQHPQIGGLRPLAEAAEEDEGEAGRAARKARQFADAAAADAEAAPASLDELRGLVQKAYRAADGAKDCNKDAQKKAKEAHRLVDKEHRREKKKLKTKRERDQSEMERALKEKAAKLQAEHERDLSRRLAGYAEADANENRMYEAVNAQQDRSALGRDADPFAPGSAAAPGAVSPLSCCMGGTYSDPLRRKLSDEDLKVRRGARKLKAPAAGPASALRSLSGPHDPTGDTHRSAASVSMLGVPGADGATTSGMTLSPSEHYAAASLTYGRKRGPLCWCCGCNWCNCCGEC